MAPPGIGSRRIVGITRPGTKKRVPLFDEQGERIRGKENREAADIALAREKLTWECESGGGTTGGEWIDARDTSGWDNVYPQKNRSKSASEERKIGKPRTFGRTVG